MQREKLAAHARGWGEPMLLLYFCDFQYILCPTNKKGVITFEKVLSHKFGNKGGGDPLDLALASHNCLRY